MRKIEMDTGKRKILKVPFLFKNFVLRGNNKIPDDEECFSIQEFAIFECRIWGRIKRCLKDLFRTKIKGMFL